MTRDRCVLRKSKLRWRAVVRPYIRRPLHLNCAIKAPPQSPQAAPPALPSPASTVASSTSSNEMVKYRNEDDDGGTLHWTVQAEVVCLTLIADFYTENGDVKIGPRVWRKWSEHVSNILRHRVPPDKLRNYRDKEAKRNNFLSSTYHGLPHLGLYEAAFEKTGASGSHQFTSETIANQTPLDIDADACNEDDDLDDNMIGSPSTRTTKMGSRSIGKGK